MIDETTLELDKGINDAIRLLELQQTVEVSISSESVTLKEDTFLLKQHISKVNEEYDFKEIDISYENNRTAYQNAQVSVESSGNIFKRMWDWIVKMWNKLFGTEAKSDEKKAQEAVDKLNKKNDKLLGWLEENKEYISQISTESMASILKDKFAVVLANANSKKPSLADIRQSVEKADKLFESENIPLIAEYIEGKKAKDLTFKSNTNSSGIELNDSKIINEPIKDRYNDHKVEAVETIGYGRNVLYFLICQSVGIAEDKSVKFYFNTESYVINDSLIKGIDLTQLKPTFEDLDAINDSYTSQNENSFEATKELISDATKFIDKSKDEKIKENFAKRISKFLKDLKGTHKKLVFAQAKNLEGVNALLKDVKDKAKTIKDANSGNESARSEAEETLNNLDITELY